MFMLCAVLDAGTALGQLDVLAGAGMMGTLIAKLERLMAEGSEVGAGIVGTEFENGVKGREV